MKKILALVLALAMMLMAVAAFAAVGEITVDTEVSVTGLDEGDIVNLYKVLEWAASEEDKNNFSWKATSTFADLAGTVLKPFIDNDKDATENFSSADLAAIATAAQKKDPIDTQTVSGTTYTYTVNAANATPITAGAGMYLALVTPKNAGVVYNPIIISADFYQKEGNDETSSIDSSATIAGTSVAKRQKLELEKTEPKITNDVGDTYSYTIVTTIPAYSEAYENQFFTLTDKVSDYLEIVGSTIKVDGEPSSYTSVDADMHGFSINFPDAYVRALKAPKQITVTYDAKLTVPADQLANLTNVKEEYNKVTVEFPNDPNDLTGKTVTALKDETREYTFTLDGKIFGHDDWTSSELVKVGQNADGTPVVEKVPYDSGESHGPLEGAKYGLYLSEEKALAAAKENVEDNQKDGIYTNDAFTTGFVFSGTDGLMQISGLDVGEYWLIELKAPDGYIRDTAAHKIKITADINGDAADEQGQKVTEYYTVTEDDNHNPVVTWHDEEVPGSTAYSYYVPVLNSYTVTVDDKNISTYTFDHTGPSLKYENKVVKDSELINTKGTELPHTGGIGTTIFYILGGLLVVGAVVILVARRKAQD
jgi:fimbrial isopeptide formation D2 family protein/LPXTG-motif cell wall-anchored protein